MPKRPSPSPPETKLGVYVPSDVHKALRILAINRSSSLRAIVLDMIRRELTAPAPPKDRSPA